MLTERTAEQQIDSADVVMLVAWRCPVCGGLVRPHSPEDASRLAAPRRCPVCKLVLVFDSPSNQLMVVPFDVAEEHTSDQSKNPQGARHFVRSAGR
jgi:hypothetical protein